MVEVHCTDKATLTFSKKKNEINILLVNNETNILNNRSCLTKIKATKIIVKPVTK